MGDEEAQRAPEVVCPHCDAVQHHEDDFCHECGHGFGFRPAGDADDFDPLEARAATTCPACLYGEIQDLPYGVRQCESCGYTARDGAPA